MAADQRGWLPAIGALISAGCILPVFPVTSGRTLDKESMTAIVPGEATTSVLLKQLGPPLAIAARGQYVSVPAASAVRSGGASCNVESGGFFNIQSDGWFEPFSARRPIRDEHRVYYWYGSRTSGFNAYLLLDSRTAAPRPPTSSWCSSTRRPIVWRTCFSTRATDSSHQSVALT